WRRDSRHLVAIAATSARQGSPACQAGSPQRRSSEAHARAEG
ncbi:MAG: hypothetical protein AVDCRST_MAG87-2681, partial [uncultured Thermomicrobiales bacterium]